MSCSIFEDEFPHELVYPCFLLGFTFFQYKSLVCSFHQFIIYFLPAATTFKSTTFKYLEMFCTAAPTLNMAKQPVSMAKQRRYWSVTPLNLDFWCHQQFQNERKSCV